MNEAKVAIKSELDDMAKRCPDFRMSAGIELRWDKIELQKSLFIWRVFASGLGQSKAVCGLALMSHLPDGVGGVTGAVLVTNEAV